MGACVGVEGPVTNPSPAKYWGMTVIGSLSKSYLIYFKMTFKTLKENVDNRLLMCFERITHLKILSLSSHHI